MTADVIPFNRFLEEREKKLDPKGYEAKKIDEAIDRQVKALEADKPLLIGETPSLDGDFDIEDVPVMDRKLLWGVGRELYENMQRYDRLLADQMQSDPGDEIDE